MSRSAGWAPDPDVAVADTPLASLTVSDTDNGMIVPSTLAAVVVLSPNGTVPPQNS